MIFAVRVPIRVLTYFVVLIILSRLLVVPGAAEAQTPQEDLMNRVFSVLSATFTPACTTPPGSAPRDCGRVTKNGTIVNASDEHAFDQARERTSVGTLIIGLTDVDVQNFFQQKLKFYSDPANNIFHGTLMKTETFALGPGTTQDAVLQVSLSPNDTGQSDAAGYMVCGNLGLELSMSLFYPNSTGVTGQPVVSNAQLELKALMRKLKQALQGGNACALVAPSPPPRALPAPAPVLATIDTADGMDVSINVAENSPPPRGWQKRVGTGKKLHYGDTFCFRGRGSVKLKWFDGTTVSFSDPSALGERGKYVYCFEINLKRPEDMTSPGTIRDGATYVLRLVTDGVPALIRMGFEVLKAPPEIEGRDVVLAIKGTRFMLGRDAAKGATILCVEEGVVRVTPTNTALAPFDVSAGNQVQVSATLVSPISQGCTPPSPVPFPQPNTNVVGMTLQTAQRFVLPGDVVTIPVWLVKGANVANINLELSYDPSVIKPEGTVGKGNLLDNALFTPNASQSGIVRAAFAQTSGLSGTGTLMNIPFRAVGKPGDSSLLLLKVTTINDPSGKTLTTDLLQGAITVVNPDGSLPSDGGPSSGGGPPGANPPVGIPRGDCDGDGVMNEVDALCALEMSTQVRPVQMIMDTDQSGDVTSRDAVIILQRAIGK